MLVPHNYFEHYINIAKLTACGWQIIYKCFGHYSAPLGFEIFVKYMVSISNLDCRLIAAKLTLSLRMPPSGSISVFDKGDVRNELNTPELPDELGLVTL